MILLRLVKPNAECLEYSANSPKAVILLLTLLRAAWRPSHGPADCELHGLSRTAQKTVRLQFGAGWENLSLIFSDCYLQSECAGSKVSVSDGENETANGEKK